MTDLQICSPETMERAICELGIVPFFTSAIPGYSIKELTQPGFWFDGEEDSLGPWDWKIDCLQNGGIAYGKFLCRGKAAFATIPFYRELMNIRRATTSPDKNGERIMDYLEKQGSITIKEARNLLGVKKGQADAAIGKLMQQCRVVTGAIERVYRGPEQVYNGWQVSYFCTPESLFEDFTTLHTDHTPEESLEFLVDHITKLTDGMATRKQVLKVLKQNKQMVKRSSTMTRDYGTMTYDYDNDHFDHELKPQHSRESGHGHSQWSWSKVPKSRVP